VREEPDHVSAAEVLAAVRARWEPEADGIEHLPIGFGAHHWAASVGGDRRLFVTLDGLAPRHTAASLEGAYAAAAGLATQGLEFVLASRPTRDGTFTVPVAGGVLSATPWREGTTCPGPHADAAEAAESARMLARLHAATPPPRCPVWVPLVAADFAAELARRLTVPWRAGPYGERVRAALRDHCDDIARWTAAYHRLAARAADRHWVATHGEPHTRNQLRTANGTLLVDWESLRLAPRERDFATLLGSGPGWLRDYGTDEPDWPMVEMFDLEWRLDEISSYADWFEAPHPGNHSDRVAFDGLCEELARQEWQPPSRHATRRLPNVGV